MTNLNVLKPFLPFLVAALLFLTLEVLISVTPLGSYFDAKISNYLTQKTDQLEQDHPRTIDVLSLGTSRTGGGFRTEAFEDHFHRKLNAFNLGFQDSDYYFFKLVLEQHIQKYGKPKLVLIEAADFLLNSKRFSQQEAIYFYKLTMQDPNFFFEIMRSPELSFDDKKETALSILSNVYRYRSLLSLQGKLADIIMSFGKPTAEAPIYQGWEKLKINATLLNPESREELAKHRVELLYNGFNNIDLIKLEAFLKYCNKNNIQLALIKWPTIKEYKEQQAYLPKYNLIKGKFEAIAAEKHIPIIDLSKVKDSENLKYFADSDHLNPLGAEYFTKSLGNEISALGILKY